MYVHTCARTHTHTTDLIPQSLAYSNIFPTPPASRPQSWVPLNVKCRSPRLINTRLQKGRRTTRTLARLHRRAGTPHPQPHLSVPAPPTRDGPKVWPSRALPLQCAWEGGARRADCSNSRSDHRKPARAPHKPASILRGEERRTSFVLTATSVRGATPGHQVGRGTIKGHYRHLKALGDFHPGNEIMTSIPDY